MISRLCRCTTLKLCPSVLIEDHVFMFLTMLKFVLLLEGIGFSSRYDHTTIVATYFSSINAISAAADFSSLKPAADACMLASRNLLAAVSCMLAIFQNTYYNK